MGLQVCLEVQEAPDPKVRLCRCIFVFPHQIRYHLWYECTFCCFVSGLFGAPGLDGLNGLGGPKGLPGTPGMDLSTQHKPFLKQYA